ncbi:MAG: dihydrolipoyl dehydrogenase [Acidobacteria bacterium]|nr:dihydrolipoyl dehydrogenase [Acidobacteriota bacterium]
MANQYDVIIIGAGTGGYPTAIRAAQLGLKAAVIERQKTLGGTCLNWGCIPTKALLEHAHALKIAQGAKEWGLVLGPEPPRIDMNQVQTRKDKIVTVLTRGIEYLFKKNGIDWIKGSGRLAGSGKVEVTGGETQVLTARQIVVATGSSARSVPGIELDRKRIITSDEAIFMREVPKSIVVMGSGPIGVEFATVFKRFGSDVTIVELLPHLVPLEDETISVELEKAFKKQGITFHTSTTVTAARAKADGVDLDMKMPDGSTQKLSAEYLLVATGRGPVTAGLGAEEAGVKLEKGYVWVDEQFRTSVADVSAIGDVITFGTPGHLQLAHLSTAEGIALAERLAGQPFHAINYDQVPKCTYCDPEISSVGLTEKQAVERGYDVRVGTFPFGALGRARIANETDGLVKIVADKKYDEVLGVHIIGPRATELVAEATLALRLESTVEELIRTIHAHPTMSEAVGEAAHATHGAAIHA